MRLEQVSALVVSEGEGLVSEKDVIRAMVDLGSRALQQPVSELERQPTGCLRIDTVANVANTSRARHLPVLENGRIAGIISLGDIVKDRFKDMELEGDTLGDKAMSHAGRELTAASPAGSDMNRHPAPVHHVKLSDGCGRLFCRFGLALLLAPVLA